MHCLTPIFLQEVPIASKPKNFTDEDLFETAAKNILVVKWEIYDLLLMSNVYNFSGELSVTFLSVVEFYLRSQWLIPTHPEITIIFW